MEVHKLGTLKYSTGKEQFIVNRRYAAAVRKARDKRGDVEAMLELEDALFHREQIEKHSLTGDFLPIPNVSRVFKFDFLESRELNEDSIFLDYSIVDYRPPSNGLPGDSQGTRYLGIKLAKDTLQMVDLGETQQVETLLHPLIETISKPPMATGSIRHFRLAESDLQKNKIDLDHLMEEVYERVVTPFEPLKPSLLISPDGMLAALPFHALFHDGRYLIEDREVAYCHSLLQKETLSVNQMSPGARAVPSVTRSALLLGDPNYTTSGLLSLPGTKIEVAQISKLLKTEKFEAGENVFEEVRVFSGAQATALRLLELEWPRVIHIAAHGDFDEEKVRLLQSQPLTFGASYRRWEQMGAWPITGLDNSLIHSFLVLSEEKDSDGDPDNGTVLTALELASLNLIGCHVVVLSACETGLGTTQNGAGVLGFQYALQACFAKAGLLSLWKVPDQETSDFMIEFYKNFFQYRSPKSGYLATARKHCRSNGQRVHPYDWAAFVLLDLEYYHPVF
jgi:CHAT domain-containing protein